jgi:hypothetical protein
MVKATFPKLCHVHTPIYMNFPRQVSDYSCAQLHHDLASTVSFGPKEALLTSMKVQTRFAMAELAASGYLIFSIRPRHTDF